MIEAEHSFKPRVRERERGGHGRTGGAQFNVVQHDLSGPRSVTYPLRTEGTGEALRRDLRVSVAVASKGGRQRRRQWLRIRRSLPLRLAIPLIKHGKHRRIGLGGRNDASLASYSQRATQRAEPFPRQEDEPERSEAERASFLLPHFAIEKIIRGRGPDKYTPEV